MAPRFIDIPAMVIYRCHRVFQVVSKDFANEYFLPINRVGKMHRIAMADRG